MFTIYFSPYPALQEYVETICIMEHESTPGGLLSPIYTMMPTHTRLLCFYLEDPLRVKQGSGPFEDRARALIIGPQLTPVTLDLGKKHAGVVVVLKPCGLYRLLGIPLREIVDRDFDARLIIGREINDVIERLMNSPGSEERNGIIQGYLLERLIKLKPALPMDRAMLQLVRAHGNLTMDFLASQSCLGVRQLERQSLERIGFPPKFFARLVRFSEAYKFKERNPHAPWTEIAHLFAYYDQMHLIRDFRYFTGVNPSTVREDGILRSLRLNSLEP